MPDRTVLFHPESDCLYLGRPSGPDFDQGVHTIDEDTLTQGHRLLVGLDRYSSVIPSGDFETYSEAGYIIDPHTGKVRGAAADGKGGLPVVGTPVYFEHPSAEVLCFWYDLKDGQGRRCWLPVMPGPQDLFDHIAAGGLFEAHNVTFEWYAWNMVCTRRYGWPPLPLEQCRCVMARCRRHSLPGGLDKAAQVLGTPRKHAEGTKLVRRLTRPHTPTAKRQAVRWTPETDWENFEKFYLYCEGDVLAEDRVAARVPDLSPYELAAWQTDQRINARGVQVDVAALDACLNILAQTERKYTAELQTLTAGQVGSVSEVAKLAAWLNAQGVHVDNVQKETVDELLGQLPPGPARRALEIRSVLGAANVKKLRTLKLQVNRDGRLRDQYTYCGADRTGRASAGGVQLQNITAKGPKVTRCESCEKLFGRSAVPPDAIPWDGGAGGACPRCGSFMFHDEPEWTIEGVEQALQDIHVQDLDFLERVWGDPIAVLCGCLRGLFTAGRDKRLMCCDFSAIEAVVAACLSRCTWRIQVFSTHGKIYEQSAANATGLTFESIIQYKKDHGTHHPARKGVGKIRELAGGYGGWINAWKQFGADEYFDNDDQIKDDVLKWREESPEIVDMWGGQFRWSGPGKWDYRPELFGLEGCFILAVQNPGQWFNHHDVAYLYDPCENVVVCHLPSGRLLHYHRPLLVPVRDKLNRGPSLQVTFEGWNSNSAKGQVGWHRMETFGGRLFENVVQAVAADIQFEALVRLESRGYPVVMHTHDEATVELPPGVGTVEDMAAIMSERPSWASWWPIRADGWEHFRYQKD